MKNNHRLQSNGHVKFEIGFDREMGHGICLHIQGEFANINMYGVLRAMLGASHRDDPLYALKTRAHPFFQSGSHDPNSDYFLIEFWTDDEESVRAWIVELENQYVHDFDMARAFLEEENKKLDKLVGLYEFRKELHLNRV